MKDLHLTPDGRIRYYDEANDMWVTRSREALEVSLNVLKKMEPIYRSTPKWKRQWMEAQAALKFLDAN